MQPADIPPLAEQRRRHSSDFVALFGIFVFVHQSDEKHLSGQHFVSKARSPQPVDSEQVFGCAFLSVRVSLNQKTTYQRGYDGEAFTVRPQFIEPKSRNSVDAFSHKLYRAISQRCSHKILSGAPDAFLTGFRKTFGALCGRN